MALVRCAECNREISDKATACPGCGAPVSVLGTGQSQAPTRVQYNRGKDTFTGTMLLVVKLAMRAVQDLGWKLDQAKEAYQLFDAQTSGKGVILPS